MKTLNELNRQIEKLEVEKQKLLKTEEKLYGQFLKWKLSPRRTYKDNVIDFELYKWYKVYNKNHSVKSHGIR